MNKLLFGGALACTIFLIAGTYFFPDDITMSLASTSGWYTAARVGIAVLLVAVIVSAPPRSLALRLAMAGVAAGLGAWGILLTVGETMHLLDVVLFLTLASAFGLESLELNEEELYERVWQLQHPMPKEPFALRDNLLGAVAIAHSLRKSNQRRPLLQA